MHKRLLVFLFLLAAGIAPAATPLPKPAPADTCPVCGMFVAKYPEWVATVLYRDGHAHHFDGAKDMFKYLHNLARYAPGHRAEDMAVIAVTEYYGVQRIDARSAWYVVGSDVFGPMGHELVPLASEDEARDFMADHGGARWVHFDEVDAPLVRAVDEGEFRR